MNAASSSPIHPISDLVDAFLEAAQSVVSVADPELSEVRPAELSYELDQVVSTYLEDHQLSPELFESIQQEVVNNIAHQLSPDEAASGSPLGFDDEGNAGVTDVISYLDQHYGVDTQQVDYDPSSSFSLDSGDTAGLG